MVTGVGHAGGGARRERGEAWLDVGFGEGEAGGVGGVGGVFEGGVDAIEVLADAGVGAHAHRGDLRHGEAGGVVVAGRNARSLAVGGS